MISFSPNPEPLTKWDLMTRKIATPAKSDELYD